jgi:hypothetical protein
MNPGGSTASSSPDIAADIVQLIAPSDREGFHAMLAHELRGLSSTLPDAELRRVVENTWRLFCKVGWPRAS